MIWTELSWKWKSEWISKSIITHTWAGHDFTRFITNQNLPKRFSPNHKWWCQREKKKKSTVIKILVCKMFCQSVKKIQRCLLKRKASGSHKSPILIYQKDRVLHILNISQWDQKLFFFLHFFYLFNFTF